MAAKWEVREFQLWRNNIKYNQRICIQGEQVDGGCQWAPYTVVTSRNTYVRFLFINFSSAFNTIWPPNL